MLISNIIHLVIQSLVGTSWHENLCILSFFQDKLAVLSKENREKEKKIKINYK